MFRSSLTLWTTTLGRLALFMTLGAVLHMPARAQGEAPPVIETRGFSMSASRDYRFALGPSVTGSEPITFQWFKDGVALAGQTGNGLVYHSLTFELAGSYRLVATNAAGSATSEAWNLNVLPELPPQVFADSQAYPTRYLEPGQTLDLDPILPQYHNPTTYHWFKDGAPIAGATENRLILPYAPDIGGSYLLMVRNDLGFSHAYIRDVAVGRSRTVPTGGWSETLVHDGIVHFLFENPGRMERFDLATGAFLPPVPTSISPSHFAILGDKIYYSTATTLRRMALNGSADEHVVDIQPRTSKLVAFNGRIYLSINIQFGYAQLFDPATGVLTNLPRLDSFETPVAVDASAGVFVGQNITVPTRYTFNADGTIQSLTRNREIREYPYGPQAWLIAGGSAVVGIDGSVFDTNQFNHRASLGVFADLAELSDSGLLILRGDSIERFNKDYASLGRVRLAQPAQAIASHAGRHFVFRQPAGSGTNLTAQEISLADFVEPRPGPTLAAAGLDLRVDDMFQDQRGLLYLHSRLHEHVWVWSPEQARFVGEFRLQNSAVAIAYSPTWDRILVGYYDGRINQIQLGDSGFVERPFARAPEQVLHLAAAGDYLVLIDPAGSWDVFISYDRDGNPVGRRELSNDSPTMIWNPARRELLTTGNSSGIVRTTMNPDGSFGEQVSGAEDSPFGPPLLLSPGHDRIVVSNGVVFDAHTHQRTGQLATGVEDGVWIGDKLFTVQTVIGGVRVSRWDANSWQRESSAMVPGYFPRLFKTTDNRVAVATEAGGTVLFSVFDSELSLASRVSHRGVDLSNTNRRLTNLSTRVNLSANDSDLLVVGFVIAGEAPLRVLIRAVGPTLSTFGVDQPLEHPTLLLFNALQQQIASNSYWGEEKRDVFSSAFTELGAFPLGDVNRDAALLATLEPGAYTAQVARPAGAGGTVLLELYDASSGTTATALSNLSTRMKSGAGDAVLTAGFVLAGDTNQSMLLRAVGPSLGRFGVPGLLEDPLLTLREGNNIRGQNDNWTGDAAVTAAAGRVGAFSLDSATSKDAAVLVTLPPGAYTAQVTGTEASATGVALVEVYQVDN